MRDAEHTILLVDDEAAILRALQRLFRREGYHILTAESGRQALDVLANASDPVSLIISDQRMPKMSGAEFLEQSRDIVPDAMRFLLTAYSDVDAVIASINRGEVQRYLTKPWNDQDLLLQTREAIEQVELRRENRRLLGLTRAQNEELQQFNRQLEDKVAARTREIEDKNKELEENLFNTVRAFAALLNVNTPALAEHSRRVSRSARAMAVALGLSKGEVDDVEIAGLLHDMAKIGYPRKLLDNHTNLWSSDDTDRYRQHPIEGQQTVQFISRLERVGDYIRSHHEYCDGTGFPDGLKQDGIPLGARLIAVANTYDRMVYAATDEQRRGKAHRASVIGHQDRSTGAQRVEAALDYLKEQAGRRFDSEVVDCFINDAASHLPAAERIIELPLAKLRPGMRLGRDLYSTNGSFLLSQGTVISAAHVVKLKYMHVKELCADIIPVVPEDASGSGKDPS